MKAYKATHNGKCIDIIYEVGKTYTFNGKIAICKQGFHFCKNVDDVLNYYKYEKDFVLLEIEVLGQMKDDHDKSVTDKFKVIRIIPKSEYNDVFVNSRFDERENLIYIKNSQEEGFAYVYDEKNRCIENRFSSGRTIKCEYDENDQCTYRYSTNCDNETNEFKYWQSFDKNNNLIYSKNVFDGSAYEEWKTYDENNNMIYYKDSKDGEIIFKYNTSNNLIYKKSTNEEEWFEYNKDNKIIYKKTNYGVESFFEYDERGNQIYKKECRGKDIKNYECWYEYDINNNLIHWKDSNCVEECVEYDENMIVSQMHKYRSVELGSSHDFVEILKKFDKNGNLIYYKNADTADEYSIIIE